MAEFPAPISNPRENDVFICYSPKNILFVKKLETAIRKQNRDPWIDLEDLPLGVDPSGPDAWQYIEAGIKDAEVFVFVISADSIKSEKCRTELDLAVKYKRRLIPVLRRQVPEKDVPEALRNIPLISVNLNDPTAFEELAKTIVHIHIHTRLLAKALEWRVQGLRKDLLLHKRDLDAVKNWISQNEGKEPQLTQLQGQYVNASADSQNLKPTRPDVFISYSRKDKESVKILCEALKQKKLDFWIDWENIPAAADWRQEIHEGIEASRTFLFIISRDSIASKYCNEEITYACKNNKRLISVIWGKGFDSGLVHPATKKYNWIPYDDNFDITLQKLLAAINTDFEYEKKHTRWLIKAIDWNDNERKEDLLLRNGELKNAQKWLLGSRAKYPGPTLLQNKYIRASQDAEDKRRQIAKSLLFLLGFVVTSVIVASFGLWLRGFTAINGEITAMISSLENNQGLDALTISLRAAERLENRGRVINMIDQSLKPGVVSALYKEIYKVKEHNRLQKHQGKVYNVSFSHNGQLIASASQDKTIILWKSDGTTVQQLYGHKEDVVSIDFDPNDQILASASYDGDIKLWDLHSIPNDRPQKPTTLSGHTDGVYVVRFSLDGRMLASASADGTVILWTREGKLFQTLRHNKQVFSVSFSPDGQTLASASEDGVRLWTQDDKFSSPKLLIHSQSASWVSFSPNGQIIAASGMEGTVKLWRQDGTEIATLKGHEGGVNRVEFSADGEVIASASDDKTARVWSRDGVLLHTLLGHEDAVYRVQFSREGQTIATAGADGTIKLWRRDDGTLLDNFEGHQDEVLSLDLSSNGHTLASASFDRTVRLWNLYGPDHPPPLVQSFPHNNRVYDVSFRPDGKVLASGGVNTIKFWRPDGTSFPPIESAHEGPISSVSFNPANNGMIASAGADGEVKLWTQSNKEGYKPQTLSIHQGAAVNNVSFSSDGKILASGSDDGTLQLFWRLDSSSTKSLTFKGHEEPVSSVSISRDGQLLASASKASSADDAKGKIKLWKIGGTPINPLISDEAAEVVEDAGDVLSTGFSPDGGLLASGGTDTTVKLWRLVSSQGNVFNLTLEKSLKRGHTVPVSKVIFSPDGNLLASASQDGTVNIWTKEGSLITTFREHHKEVSGIRFSPDSKSFASASYDKHVLLWRSPNGFNNDLLSQLLPYGCALLRDYLATPKMSDTTNAVASKKVSDFCRRHPM